jgi:hypothetical protein
MCKRVTVYLRAVALIILAVSVQAQPPNSIAVNSPGLNCTTPAGADTFAVTSYTLSAEQPAPAPAPSPGTASPPGAIVGPLLLNKASDGCSPALFQLLVDGSVLDTVTLVDNRGKKIMFLKTGRLTTAQIRDPENPLPPETIVLHFERIAITYIDQQGKSKTVCWDNIGKTSRCAL